MFELIKKVRHKDLYAKVLSGEVGKSKFYRWLDEYSFKHWMKGCDKGEEDTAPHKVDMRNLQIYSIEDLTWVREVIYKEIKRRCTLEIKKLKSKHEQSTRP